MPFKSSFLGFFQKSGVYQTSAGLVFILPHIDMPADGMDVSQSPLFKIIDFCQKNGVSAHIVAPVRAHSHPLWQRLMGSANLPFIYHYQLKHTKRHGLSADIVCYYPGYILGKWHAKGKQKPEVFLQTNSICYQRYRDLNAFSQVPKIGSFLQAAIPFAESTDKASNLSEAAILMVAEQLKVNRKKQTQSYQEAVAMTQNHALSIMQAMFSSKRQQGGVPPISPVHPIQPPTPKPKA